MTYSNDTPVATPTIWCETCSRVAPLNEWRRKLCRTPVVVGTAVIGYTSTYEHRACRVFTAVPVNNGPAKTYTEVAAG